jgi:phage shock protein A
MRLCKADLHGVMDQLEDKQLLLKQHVREMTEALDRQQARLGRLESTGRQTARRLQEYRHKTQVMEADIRLALEKGRDEIARMLIRKHHPLARMAEALEAQQGLLTAELAAGRELMAQQALQLDQIRQRVALADANGREAGLAEAEPGARGGLGEPSEEEIELTLLQFKARFAEGRAK